MDYEEVLMIAESNLDLLALNPINLEQAKDRFFSGENIDFKYEPWKRNESFDSLAELAPEGPFADFMKEKARELELQARMLQSIGTTEFTAESLKLYPLPSKPTLEYAQKLLLEKNQDTRGDDTDVKILERPLRELGWKLAHKEMASTAAADPSHRTLYLSRARLPRTEITRLLVHEIGVHVLRAENGFAQAHKILGVGLAGYLPTEEGLAVHMEQEHGVASNTLRIYAGRALAVHWSQEMGISAVYKKLIEHFNAQSAWTIATRAKRGLTDPELPGGLTKDACYLEGYLQVLRFSGRINDLYIGKVGTQHLEHLERIRAKPALHPPEKIKYLLSLVKLDGP